MKKRMRGRLRKPRKQRRPRLPDCKGKSAEEAETERLLQETQLSLQTQTEENAILVQQQDELNQRLQALTTERDAALYRNDDDSRLLSETRELLQAEIQLKEELTQQLDIATSRELKVTLERDSAIVRENSLEAQLGPLREQINANLSR